MVQFQTLQGPAQATQGSQSGSYIPTLMENAKKKKEEGPGFWGKTLGLVAPWAAPMVDGKEGYDWGTAAKQTLKTGLVVAGAMTGNPMLIGAGLQSTYGGGGQPGSTGGGILGSLLGNTKGDATSAATPAAGDTISAAATPKYMAQGNSLLNATGDEGNGYDGSMWDWENPTKRKSLNSLLGSYA